MDKEPNWITPSVLTGIPVHEEDNNDIFHTECESEGDSQTDSDSASLVADRETASLAAADMDYEPPGTFPISSEESDVSH